VTAGARRRGRIVVAAVLAVTLLCGLITLIRHVEHVTKTWVAAYFDNSNMLFPGDDVLILGVPVGRVDKIEPEPTRAKVTFWVDSKYRIPADAKAVILSPQLVTGRAIQITPVYQGGPAMQTGAVIGIDHTAVPVEWDDVREQLKRLARLLKPTDPGGVSTLGGLVNTAADNLRGQGSNIRDAIIKLSQTISVLSDHSDDIFGTVKNLGTLVSALHDSADLLEQLNGNLATVSGLVADDPRKVGQAFEDLNSVVGDLGTFVADNRDAVGTATDKVGSISTALVASLDDLKQTLHILPNTMQNFYNIYEPASGSLSANFDFSNFANPVSFICGAVQAASRLGAEQSSKLCTQYLAPIMKNRQYNFPPLGANLVVGAQARPNEVTYSEPWLRPDFVPPAPAEPATAPAGTPPSDPPTATPTDPGAGLPGLMVPSTAAGGGS
jgi:phospholipid/cholesterol/gamma-HCH transport system substrate-binding protein